MQLEWGTWSVLILHDEGNKSSSTPTFHTHPWCSSCQNHYLFVAFVVSAGGKVGNLYRPPVNRRTHARRHAHRTARAHSYTLRCVPAQRTFTV